MQACLAAAQTAEGLAQDADLDWSDTERVGFVLRNLIDALAPSNNPVLNPAALKAAIDTGGGSALAGLRHFAADMASPPWIPSMVEPDAYRPFSPTEIFRIFIQVLLRGAGGARTHDRRIMRSMASCTERASCNDGTDHRTDGSRCSGII
jgi:hypothetical protein